MAVRILRPTGNHVECDTAAEALVLLDLLEGRDHREANRLPRQEPIDVPNKSGGQRAELGEEGTRFIQILAKRREGMPTDALAEAVGVRTGRLPTIMKKATAALKDHGYENPVSCKRITINGANKSQYRVSAEVARKYGEE